MLEDSVLSRSLCMSSPAFVFVVCFPCMLGTEDLARQPLIKGEFTHNVPLCSRKYFAPLNVSFSIMKNICQAPSCQTVALRTP